MHSLSGYYVEVPGHVYGPGASRPGDELSVAVGCKADRISEPASDMLAKGKFLLQGFEPAVLLGCGRLKPSRRVF